MKIVSFEKQVGYPVTYKGNRDRTNQNKKTDEANRTVARIARLPKGFGFEARARLIETNATPGTNLPSSAGCRASAHITNNAHPLAHRSKHENERDCAGSTVRRTQDRPSTGLGVPNPDNTENDAQEQRDMDPVVDRHGKPCRIEESNQAQREWRPTLTESSGGLGVHGRTRSR